MGEQLDDLGFSNDFLDMATKVGSIKEVIDYLEFIKMKSSCSVKDTAKVMRREATGRTYLQNTKLMKDSYPKYIKNY